MDFTFIIIIIAAVFLIGLFFVLVKNIIKTIFFSTGIFLIIALFIGIFFYVDFRNFSSSIYGEDKLFLLEDNDRIVVGMKVGKLDEGAFKAQHNFISQSKLDEYSALYEKKDYEGILESNFKLFIFDNDIYKIEQSDDAFSDFLEENVEKSSYIFILKEFKKGNIIIYPKTLLFKIAQISPISLIDKIKKRFIDA